MGEHTLQRRQEDKQFYNTLDDNRILDIRLSNAFERTYRYYKAGARLSRNRDDDKLTISVDFQRSDLQGSTTTRTPNLIADIARGYTHILPRIFYSRTLKENQTIEIRYRSTTREPSLRELQPYTNNNNPLRIYVGNPNLIPENKHSLSASFRSFDQWTYISVFASAQSSYTRNRIVPTRTIDENLRQVVSAVNSDGGWTTQGGFNFSMPIRPLGIKISLNNDLSLSTGSEFINDQENESTILRNTASFRISNRNQDILELNAKASATFNKVDYSLNETLGQQYINTVYSADIAWHLTYNWTISADANYRAYDQDVFGGAQNMFLMNFSLSRLLMSERAEIELVVNDLFNQNLGVTFSNTGTYIQEQRVETLGRYVMLRLSYRLNALGSLGLF